MFDSRDAHYIIEEHVTEDVIQVDQNRDPDSCDDADAMPDDHVMSSVDVTATTPILMIDPAEVKDLPEHNENTVKLHVVGTSSSDVIPCTDVTPCADVIAEASHGKEPSKKMGARIVTESNSVSKRVNDSRLCDNNNDSTNATPTASRTKIEQDTKELDKEPEADSSTSINYKLRIHKDTLPRKAVRQSKWLSCNVCSKRFFTKIGMRKHIKDHERKGQLKKLTRSRKDNDSTLEKVRSTRLKRPKNRRMVRHVRLPKYATVLIISVILVRAENVQMKIT